MMVGGAVIAAAGIAGVGYVIGTRTPPDAPAQDTAVQTALVAPQEDAVQPAPARKDPPAAEAVPMVPPSIDEVRLEPDGLAIVDVDPTSKTYSQIGQAFAETLLANPTP